MIYQLSLIPKAIYSFFRKIAGISLALHRFRLRLRSNPIIRQLEQDADKLANIIKESWILFTQLVERIQNLGIWRLEAPDWKSYCRKRWNIDPSRISQYRSALPYAMALKNAGQDNLLEATIRKIKKARIPADSPLLAASYQLALEVAKEKGRAPTEAMFKRAHQILQDAENTGYVNVGDIDIPIKDVASAVFAVKKTMQEAVDTALEGKSVPVKCKARRCGEYWIIEADGNLPDEYFEFTTYVKERGKS